MSEEEDYDVFNDETFGDDVEEFDWDANQEEFSRIVEHEKSPEQHSPDELLYNDDPFRGVADWQDNHLMTTDLLLSGDNSELPQQQQSEYVLFPDQTKNSSAFGELYSHNTFLEHPFNSNVVDDLLLKFDDRTTTTTTHQQRPNDYFSSFSSNNSTTKTSNGWDTASLENGYFPSINFDSYDTLNNKRNKSADEILSSQLLTCLSSVPYSKSPPPLLNSFREETILLDENQSQLNNSSFSGTTIADDLLLLEQTTCESERDTFSNNKSDVISEDVAAVVAQHTTTPEETIDAAKINNENPVEAVSKDDEVVDGSGGKPSADMMEAFFTFLPPQIKNNVAAIKFHLEKIKSKINTASACYTDHDDYAALMTEREKYWLAGIQLLPVNSMNSFRDDYYFSMYQLRHSTRRKHQQQLSSMKESAFRKNQNGTAAIFKDYTPIQFENSLGKVQIGSALAPRKVIDMYDVKYDNSSSVKAVAYDENDEDMTIIADENDGGGKKITTTTSSYKLKTLLLKIEDIYAKILLYEDLHNSMVEKSRELQTIADNDDEQQPSSVEDGETVMVDIKRKMESVMVDVGKKLLSSSKNDFLTYMSVRKGRRLVLRYLAYCNNPADVWMMIFQNFNEITWQDKSDGLLLFYLPYFRNWLSKVSLNLLIKMAECLTYNIVTVIRNKFGVSVLANMVEHAEMIFNSADKNEQTVWTNFIIYLAQQLNSKTVAGAEKPVICLKEQTLFSHLSKCKKLKNGYVTGMINLFTNLVVK